MYAPRREDLPNFGSRQIRSRFSPPLFGHFVFKMVLFAVADFCLIPMATPTPSVGKYIAEVQKVLARYEKEHGLKYEMQ
ncbi:unnamed protein product [Sympodiomycopsis kandeliae]